MLSDIAHKIRPKIAPLEDENLTTISLIKKCIRFAPNLQQKSTNFVLIVVKTVAALKYNIFSFVHCYVML